MRKHGGSLSLATALILLSLVENNLVASQDSCRMVIAETIPRHLIFPNGSTPHSSTYETWLGLINGAEHSIEIGSFEWHLRGANRSREGDDIFDALSRAGTERDVRIRIVQNAPRNGSLRSDTEELVERHAAEVRSLNFTKLSLGGILHTKLMIFDRRHLYIGSANMGRWALLQKKEVGIAVYDCARLAEDAGKIFDVKYTVFNKTAGFGL